MNLQFSIAQGVGALSTWGLKRVLRRQAGNFPGKIALILDPSLLKNLRSKMRKGSMLVVGTNGKTTTTNLIADAIEADGQTVICNRDGANLDSGVATALLQADPADWGIFETDELWLAKILPHLQCNYVLLLNLFYDQMDRIAEIDTIQNSILVALAASPNTVLIYNADDPNCAYIAKRTTNQTMAFGVAEHLSAQQSAQDKAIASADVSTANVANAPTVPNAPLQLCQLCGYPLVYSSRQYDQLGIYHCTSCDFAHPAYDFEAHNILLDAGKIAFDLRGPAFDWQIQANVHGSYMVYNMASVAVGAYLTGCSQGATVHAIHSFAPTNGRLQTLTIQGHTVLTNLAKNPTGFDQNVAIIARAQNPVCAAFFVNDKEGDGRDVSWLWDINFEALAHKDNLTVFAGGIRALDVQLRLKYAGINARVIESVSNIFTFAPQISKTTAVQTTPNDASNIDVFLVANYTALPPVLAEAKQLAAMVTIPGTTPQASTPLSDTTQADKPSASAFQKNEHRVEHQVNNQKDIVTATVDSTQATDKNVDKTTPSENAVHIVKLLPDVLNLFGDTKNATILSKRLTWRGIPSTTRCITHDMCQAENINQAIALIETADVVCIGTGTTRALRLAHKDLMPLANTLTNFVDNHGVLLAIDSGFQLIGTTLTIEGNAPQGLNLVSMTSMITEDAPRMVGDIAGHSQLAQLPVIGYENHTARTHLSQAATPFIELNTQGKHGNNDDDAPDTDGVLQATVLGTYLHGPVLAKNPEVADALLSSALEHVRLRCGYEIPALSPLDDQIERDANAFMAQRLQA